MDGRLLILLTNYYPFHTGEEYLEREIGIACQAFDRVLVIPTMAGLPMRQTRPIPPNTEVLRLDVDCSAIGKAGMVLRQAGGVLAGTGWREVLRQETGCSPVKLAYAFYYRCRTEEVFRLISRHPRFRQLAGEYREKLLYSYWMHVTASVAVRLKERFFQGKVKAVTRGHRYDLYGYAAPCGFIPDRQRMLEWMDAVYPCSDDGAGYLCSHFPEYKEKISVRRLGTSGGEPIRCSREPAFQLVSCSVVRKVKRLDKIIGVVAALLADGYPVRWTHLGGGPELQAVRKLAGRRLPEGCYSFAGQMSNAEVFGWYQSHPVSCLINLSDSEGVPVSIMEAMGLGIPVIATDAGGSGEIVADGQNGYLVGREMTIEQIKERVEKMIGMDEASYQALCAHSRRLWRERADAEKLYADFYRQPPG